MSITQAPHTFIHLFSGLCLLACTPNKTSDTDSAQINTEDTSSLTDSTSVDTDTEDFDSADTELPFEDCLTDMEAPLEWFEAQNSTGLDGTIWFGHTHVTQSNDSRWAPRPVAFRDTALLFEPTNPLTDDTDLRILARRGGESLGVLPLRPPNDLPTIMEQGLTDEILESWSDTAWSVDVPWIWMEENVELHIGFETEDGLFEHIHTLTELGAPHRFTVSRSKIVLFGEDSFDTTTYSAQQLGLDFFSVLPISELAWVDSTNWVLDEIVVRGQNGPVKVTSESERLAQTSDPDRWGILKNIFTHRLNLANIGQGLTNTTFSGGNSPYSFGTTLGMGWIVDENNNYVDINNAPYSAGWTGWSAIWHGECGNVFNHEIGHSFTLAHFREGAASSWGVEDQYPDDGVNLNTHPWGYDTVHKQFRSWYRVNTNGIVVQDDGSVQGKRDSMNGGESSNSLHCFPQYTGYHAWKIQNWMESTPTFSQIGGTTDIVQWNTEVRRYTPVDLSVDYERPLLISAPVVTIVGALADTTIASDANHIYPPIFWDSGNAFPLIDPTQSGLTEFTGANYVAEITNVNGDIEYTLINRSTVDGTDLHLFSFNIPLNDNPTQIRLLHSESPYPNINLATATVLATQSFEAPTTLPRASIMGRETLNAGVLNLDSWCEEGINCTTRNAELLWSDDEVLTFHAADTPAQNCSEEGSFTEFTVELVHESGDRAQATLHGQRIVQSVEQTWTVAMNDATPWSQHPNIRQSVRLWIPFAQNTHLSAGNWSSTDATLTVQAGIDDPINLGSININIDITIEPSTLVSLNEVIESESISLEDSSLYFLVNEDSVGPTTKEWWGSNTFTPLNIPMVDTDTGEPTTIAVNSYKQTCNLGWGTLWTLNSGQVSDPCTYQVRLEMPEAGNEHLISGHTYRSPGSQPIIFEGRRWHDPNSNAVVGRFIWQMEYTTP